MVKIFTTNKNGKIELTEKELKQLLDDVYWEGYRDNNHTWTYTSPHYYPYWYSTTGTPLTSDSITISSNDMAKHTITLGKDCATTTTSTAYVNNKIGD